MRAQVNVLTGQRSLPFVSDLLIVTLMLSSLWTPDAQDMDALRKVTIFEWLDTFIKARCLIKRSSCCHDARP
jgi:hypothetical protein